MDFPMLIAQQATETLDLVGLFHRGGFVMWPLLACSLLAVAGILDRLSFFVFRQRYRFDSVLEEIRPLAKSDSPDLSKLTRSDPISTLAALYLENLDTSTEHRRNVILRCADQFMGQAEKRTRLLSTIAALSPLIGLLGTVWGMVEAFATIESLEQVKPADVAGGIWSALLTTVFGLVIAIPTVVVSRWCEGRIEKLARDMNRVISHLDDWTGKVTQR